MNRKQREEAASLLLNAKGAVSCFIPLMERNTIDENHVLGVPAGNILNTMEKIDKVLKLLGHTGGGSCEKRKSK